MSPTTLMIAHWMAWIALAMACVIAALRGERPERLGALVTAIGWAATPLVEFRQSWYQPQFGMFAVDAAVLAGFVLLQMRYGRYWLIYAAALQSVTVLSHVAFMIDPRALYRAFYFANVAIGYLILGAIIGGVIIECPPRRAHD